MAPYDGKFHVKPTFWLPREGLREKAARDRVPYDLWHRDGFLETTPGKSVEYEFVAEYLRGVFDRYAVVQLGFDDWNFRHLKPWLIRAGFPEEEIEAKIHPDPAELQGHVAGAAESRERDCSNRRSSTTGIRCCRCARRMPWWSATARKTAC